MFSVRKNRTEEPDSIVPSVPDQPLPSTSAREQALEQALTALADLLEFGQGDLTKRIEVEVTDPVAQRAVTQVEAFMAKVSSMRLQLEQMTEETSLAAAKSGHQIKQIARHMSESHQQLAQAVTGVEQNQTGVSEVAQAATSAADLAGQAEEATAAGAQVIRRAIDSIDQIQSDITLAKGRVEILSERSEQISKVSGIIESIAKRTNLLALNAAIEAARAGQHGRGFAVVADEVRKLAESTSQQTKEIRTLVSAIAGDLGQTEAAINSAKERADDGVALAAQAEGALVQIQDLVKRSADPITSIASLAEEQSAALEQVTASLQLVAESVGAVTEQASTVAEMTADLSGMTEKAFSSLSLFQSGSKVDEVTNLARRLAGDVQSVLESVVDQGQVSLEAMLDHTYFEYKGAHIEKLKRLWNGEISRAPRAGFTPPKYGTAYDTLVDVELKELLDRYREMSKEIGFLVLSDLNGYSPAQNSYYCRPWTGDWNVDVHSRVKRMNADFAQVRAARMGLAWTEQESLTTGEADVRNMRTVHTRREFLAAGLDLSEPLGGDRRVLVQTFTRFTGTVVNILSVPLYVKGQRYGVMIIGWLPERKG
ncbi:MAG TPA: methyl-accepting chemotaxis protein [Symbiobacteriaceae bacterium]|nr:methyl-accepting chemotaxis protein [Symbiobacteriaceae bacterium]